MSYFLTWYGIGNPIFPIFPFLILLAKLEMRCGMKRLTLSLVWCGALLCWWWLVCIVHVDLTNKNVNSKMMLLHAFLSRDSHYNNVKSQKERIFFSEEKTQVDGRSMIWSSSSVIFKYLPAGFSSFTSEVQGAS